jgi:hypothetical protein
MYVETLIADLPSIKIFFGGTAEERTSTVVGLLACLAERLEEQMRNTLSG